MLVHLCCSEAATHEAKQTSPSKETKKFVVGGQRNREETLNFLERHR